MRWFLFRTIFTQHSLVKRITHPSRIPAYPPGFRYPIEGRLAGGGQEVNVNRESVIRTLTVVFLGLAGVVAAFTIRIAPRWLRVTRLVVNVPGLPREWNGLRIAHLSDFHLGARGMTSDHLHKARQIALEFEPDIIALTGDFYDAGTRIPSDGLFTSWPDGVPAIAVTGNHDHKPQGSIARTISELEDGGVAVLQNRAISIDLKGREAWIAGVDDAHTFNADVEKAFADVPPGETVLLFLSHSPAPIRDLKPGQARVMLSGHTHGGQVRLLPSGDVPFIRLLRRMRGAVERPDGPVFRKWHWINGTIVIVSEGLGVSTFPVRFRTRPQLILIELQRAPGGAAEACDDIDRYVREVEPEPWLLRKLT